VPPGLRLRRASDLVPFLPDRMPRFRAGVRPIPGVDLELVELLGVGGFGEVWKARNPHLANIPPVALKFCLDPEARTRLLRHEAAVLNQVMQQGKHPGIVELRHTYLSADPPCLEYEYVEGSDLTGLIRSMHPDGAGPSPAAVSRAAQVVAQLARIVGHAHELRPPIVHRDLKPGNILVRRVGEGVLHFKVADFGIGGLAASHSIKAASLTSVPSLYQASLAHGTHTPLYASPQQMRGEDPDPRDDVHALGVIWYQLLTGDLSTGAPAGLDWPDDLKASGMTEAQVQLLASCFSSRPERRPASAAVLARQLQELLDGGDGKREARPPAREPAPSPPMELPPPPPKAPKVSSAGGVPLPAPKPAPRPAPKPPAPAPAPAKVPPTVVTKKAPNEDTVLGCVAMLGVLIGPALYMLLFDWSWWGILAAVVVGFLGLGFAAAAIVPNGDGALGLSGIVGVGLGVWTGVHWEWAWYWDVLAAILGFCAGAVFAGAIQDAAKKKK
jgi:serine/threonine protein kinase